MGAEPVKPSPHDGLTLIASVVALAAGVGWLLVAIITAAADAAQITGSFQ